MDENPIPDEKKGKPLEKIFLIILIVIILIAASFFVYYNVLSDQTGSNNLVLTTSFNMISSKDAYEFINTTTKDLTIIDIRGCKCNYDKNHLLGAIWDTHPESFYNTTDDLLVYDIDGTKSIDFCERLVNKVYGKILFLQGGIDTWIALGYPVIV